MKCITITLAVACALLATAARAGDTNPPAGPINGTMKTLEQVEPRTLIDAIPFPITTPGSYYLTTDLEIPFCGGEGILIDADDVTLDLNGFSIFQPGFQCADGIRVNGARRNIAIKNGTVRGCANGIDATTATNCRYENLHVSGSGLNGILTGSDSTLSRCTASDNDLEGVGAAGALVASHCTFADNGQSGLRVGAPAPFNTSSITNCTARNNGWSGFRLPAGSSISNCTAVVNGLSGSPGTTDRHGISVGEASSVSNCATRGNADYGIQTFQDATISASTADLNGVAGIFASANCVVRGCSAANNSGGGIRVFDGSLVSECSASQNTATGIESTDSLVIGCIARNNATAYIFNAGGSSVNNF